MDAIFYCPQSASAIPDRSAWGHVDYNSFINETREWQVFQSVVSLWETNSLTDWATVMWPQSHISTFPALMRSLGEKEEREEFEHFVLLSKVFGEASEFCQRCTILTTHSTTNISLLLDSSVKVAESLSQPVP